MKLVSPKKISASYHMAKYPAIVKNINDRYCVAWQDNRRSNIYNIYAEVCSYDNVFYTAPNYYTDQKYDCVQPDVCADSTGRFHAIYAAFRGDLNWSYKYDCDDTFSNSGWTAAGIEYANNGILSVQVGYPSSPTFYADRSFSNLKKSTGYVAEVKFKIENYTGYYSGPYNPGTYTNSGEQTLYFRDGTNEVRIDCSYNAIKVYASWSGGSYFNYYTDCTQWTTIRVTKGAGLSTIYVQVNGVSIYTSPLTVLASTSSSEVGFLLSYNLSPPFPSGQLVYLDYLYVNDTGPTLSGSAETSDIGYVDFKQDGTDIHTSILFTGIDNTSCYPIIKSISDDTLRAVWQGTLGAGNCYEILFAKTTNAGALVGAPAIITHSGVAAQHPHMAIDSSDNVYIVWDDRRTAGNEQIYIMKLSPAGAVLVAATQVSTTGKNYFPRVALIDNAPVIVWHKYYNNKYQISFQKLSATCVPIGTEINISPEGDQALYPDIMIGSDGYYHIVWHEYESGEGFYIYYRIMDTANNFVTHHKRINWKQGDNRFPKIVDNGTKTTILLQDLAATEAGYAYVTNISGFPDKGILAIGIEMLTYGSRIEIASGMSSVTSLLTSLDALATDIGVVSTQAFPATGVVQIDLERIYYSGKTLTSFTGCTRGFDGTTAAFHFGGLVSLTPQAAVLVTGINSTATSIGVVSTANFPASGSVTIDSERIFYANKDATHFLNCVRGYEGYTPISHLVTAPATLNIYAFEVEGRGQGGTAAEDHTAGNIVTTDQVYPKIVFHADSGYLYNYEIYDIHSENDAPLDVEIKDILNTSNYSFIYNATALPEVSVPPWTVISSGGVEPVCSAGSMHNASGASSRWGWSIQSPILFTYLSDEFDMEFRCQEQIDIPAGPEWSYHQFYATDGGNFMATITVQPYDSTYGPINNLEFDFGYSGGGIIVTFSTSYPGASSLHTYAIRYRRPSVEFLIDSLVVYSSAWDHPINGDYVYLGMDLGFVSAGAGSGNVVSAKILKNIVQVKQIPPITNIKSYLSNISY